jgi:hypothetical protein
MICKPCQQGATLYLQELDEDAAAAHAECPGPGWCDCQHKKPKPEVTYARA